MSAHSPARCGWPPLSTLKDSVGRAPRLLGRRCACRAPEWIRRELHAYALPNGAYRDLGEKRLVESLHAVYPETRAAKVVDERQERRERRVDCPPRAVRGLIPFREGRAGWSGGRRAAAAG